MRPQPVPARKLPAGTPVESIVFVGGGPAGYSGAIYAARAGLDPLVVEGPLPGGLLTQTTLVENYPGFAKGIQGPDLMVAMKAQAEEFGTRFKLGKVTEADFSARPFCLTVDGARGPEQIYADSVIVGTGSSPHYPPGVEGLEEHLNQGVSACATCDGHLFVGKPVAVVGGGDTAMEEALYLANQSPVTLVHRRDEFRASPVMVERAKNHPNITILTNTQIARIYGDDAVTGVGLVETGGDERDLPVSAVFYATGHTPNTGFMPHDLLTQEGLVRTVPGTGETKVRGVYAAGDVQDDVFRQAVTSAGSGAAASILAGRELLDGGRSEYPRAVEQAVAAAKQQLTSVTASTFRQEVLESDVPVLVDFWHQECGPCKALMPAMEELAAALGERVKIVKLNVREEPALAEELDGKFVPTVMLFHKGERVEVVNDDNEAVTVDRVRAMLASHDADLEDP
jgi:thioredoxin reductase (NADPH)